MRRYVSIDIETTGLEDWCQILEVGAVIDDGGPLESLARFQCYLIHPQIVGQPYALSMHAAILRRIADKEPGFHYWTPAVFVGNFRAWLMGHGLREDKILAAGKNFASFDLQFLNRLPGFREQIHFKHRFLDPAMKFFRPEIDDGPPDTKTCMERAGIPGDVQHTAIEDALVVIQLLRAFN
jgi:oligoribonuclease